MGINAPRSKKLLIALLVAVLAAAGIFLILTQKEYSLDFMAMDTYDSVKVSGIEGKAAAEKAREITENLDVNVLSRHSEKSLIYALNRDGRAEIPAEYGQYFSTMIDACSESGGAFDFTLGKISDLWGIGTDNERVPEEDEIKAALDKSGADKTGYDGGTFTVPEGLSVDMGAAGKGIALDEIRKAYSSMSVRRAVVSLGGSILLYGKGDFTVGIQTPGGSGYMAVLNLKQCCVSTSGSYERYFEKDGVRYHHILDPETGYPADSGLVSVTVVSDSGTLSDILSTACFVLGLENGKALCEKFGCEAVFIDSENTVHVTDGIKDKLEITDDTYRLEESR